jgi:hypothetical protein
MATSTTAGPGPKAAVPPEQQEQHADEAGGEECRPRQVEAGFLGAGSTVPVGVAAQADGGQPGAGQRRRPEPGERPPPMEVLDHHAAEKGPELKPGSDGHVVGGQRPAPLVGGKGLDQQGRTTAHAHRPPQPLRQLGHDQPRQRGCQRRKEGAGGEAGQAAGIDPRRPGEVGQPTECDQRGGDDDQGGSAHHLDPRDPGVEIPRMTGRATRKTPAWSESSTDPARIRAAVEAGPLPRSGLASPSVIGVEQGERGQREPSQPRPEAGQGRWYVKDVRRGVTARGRSPSLRR